MERFPSEFEMESSGTLAFAATLPQVMIYKGGETGNVVRPAEKRRKRNVMGVDVAIKAEDSKTSSRSSNISNDRSTNNNSLSLNLSSSTHYGNSSSSSSSSPQYSNNRSSSSSSSDSLSVPHDANVSRRDRREKRLWCHESWRKKAWVSGRTMLGSESAQEPTTFPLISSVLG